MISTDSELKPFPPFIEKQLPGGVRRQLLNVGSQKMHVMTYGDGYPLLLMHGNPTWGFLWRKILPLLDQKKFCAIMPDLIGLGFSSEPGRKAHSIENHATWLGLAIDQLKIKELIFCGQDWGGPIGLRMLADRPGLAKGLVLLNTGIAVPPMPRREGAFHRLSRKPVISNLLFDVLGFPLKTLHLVQGDKNSIRGDVAKAYWHAVRKNGHYGSALSLARMVPNHESHPSVESLRKCERFATAFSGPIEIVWGTRDPVLGRALKRVKSLLPTANVTETNAGHFLQEEVPVEIGRAIHKVYDDTFKPR
jgi:cis-3-alkyl-4-acyloxetan-2-one decarboxylase